MVSAPQLSQQKPHELRGRHTLQPLLRFQLRLVASDRGPQLRQDFGQAFRHRLKPEAHRFAEKNHVVETILVIHWDKTLGALWHLAFLFFQILISVLLVILSWVMAPPEG